MGDDANILEVGTLDQESCADDPFEGNQHNFSSPLFLLAQKRHQSPLYPPFPPFLFKTECYTYTQGLTNLFTLTLKMEAVHTSETSVTSPTTHCNNPKTGLTYPPAAKTIIKLSIICYFCTLFSYKLPLSFIFSAIPSFTLKTAFAKA